MRMKQIHKITGGAESLLGVREPPRSGGLILMNIYSNNLPFSSTEQMKETVAGCDVTLSMEVVGRLKQY